MICADAGSFFALFVEADERHKAANRWSLANPNQLLVTTDHVIDELLTLMRAKRVRQEALRVGSLLIEHRFCAVETVQPGDFQDG